jgi:pimeloyl-ACP methyl ester carboxylesterase
VTPAPITLRSADGLRLAGLLSPPPRPGAPGVAVVHGYTSRKENHLQFMAACAGAGMDSLALDVRGHGDSDGPLGPGALDDVLAALDALGAAGCGPLGVRGSSMGGFLALHAAGRHPAVRAVVAICPARPWRLGAVIGQDWPTAMPLEPAVTRQGVARAYYHAVGDTSVPWTHSARLADLSPQPVERLFVLGGTHRSMQADPAVHARAVDFLARHLGADAG